MATKLEDLDPSFAKSPKRPEKKDTSELEKLDPIFARPAPRFETNEPIEFQPKTPTDAVKKVFSEAFDIDPGIAATVGLGAGTVLGSVEQGANVARFIRPPKEMGPAPAKPALPGSSGQKWLQNWAGMDRPITGGVPEGAQAYERAKTHGEAGGKMFKRYGNMPLDIGRQAQMAQQTAQAGPDLAGAARKFSRGLGYVPGLSVLTGAAGGQELGEASQRFQQGDPIGAAIQGIGGLGAMASLIPHPVPRMIGGGLGLLSMPTLYYYDMLTGRRPRPEFEEVPPLMSP